MNGAGRGVLAVVSTARCSAVHLARPPSSSAACALWPRRSSAIQARAARRPGVVPVDHDARRVADAEALERRGELLGSGELVRHAAHGGRHGGKGEEQRAGNVGGAVRLVVVTDLQHDHVRRIEVRGQPRGLNHVLGMVADPPLAAIGRLGRQPRREREGGEDGQGEFAHRGAPRSGWRGKMPVGAWGCNGRARQVVGGRL